MKLNTGALLAMAFLVVGLAAGVGILQLRQLVNTPKASVSTGSVLFDVNGLDVRVILDPQNNPVSFAKIDLSFDKNVLSLSSFTLNNRLNTVIASPSTTSANSTGVISTILGLAPADRNNAPATAFDFITLKFTAKTNTGSTSQIAFDAANSQIVDMANQQISISSTPASVSTVGEPNSCGGTCGSHANCKAGFFCYSGYCRNPQCPSQTNCSCPTPTPTAKPVVKTKPTPVTVNYTPPTPTPYVYQAPVPSVEPVSYAPAEENVSIWTRIVRFILRLFGIKY